ncbi:MAG TPA: DUF1003 domain-containing protein [Candidatus Eisenbacteria bacterium]|nr:DUF1003 domain-containing protein [Candidatus Eisenbacteria bacterium]
MADRDREQQESLRRADHPAQRNVRTISKIEHDALRTRSAGERLSDTLVRALGSVPSIALHLLLLLAWIVVNTGAIPGLARFDPFPFGVLTLFVSAEGVLLALIILISQNRMIRQADRRAHLDLQINLLAEQEATLTLHMLRRIGRQVGVAPDALDGEAKSLIEQTDVYSMMRHLENQLPKE